MSNKRIPRRDYRPPVSAGAVALWRQCCEFERQGRQDEWLMAGKQLAVLCGLDWASMAWPTLVTRERPPPHIARNECLAPCWAEAWRTRLALIEADAAADREAVA
jgi:hypothetical protein